jgi:hypothetical protein
LQGNVYVPARNRPAHNFYIKNRMKCGGSSHGSYNGTASAKMVRQSE